MASSLPLPKLPDYVVCSKIGSGAYGDVYKAYKKTTKEYFAIKAVSRTDLSSGATESLITEIRLLKRLNHDHIVQLKDFLCDENYIYIIMEYCSGGDLSHFIRSRHRLPELACQRFLQQIASALKYMRDEKISHFDLKPQNILLSSRRNPVVKIGDFGLAQRLSESESMSKVKGSPLYMAPEILLHKNYDAKVDLWSVGVILYECLFGKAPYSSSTMEELITKIKTDKQIQVPLNSSISASCRNLLIHLLERDSQKRIEFDDFFSHPFVDLEHKPSLENMDKARCMLSEAVAHDERHEYEEALTLYLDSLLYLVPAIYVERDMAKKMSLRKSVKEYLNRTETLKKLLANEGNATEFPIVELLPSLEYQQLDAATSYNNNNSEPSPSSATVMGSTSRFASPDADISELLTVSATTPGMCGALDIGKSAELYEQEGSYAIALEKYEMALGKLLTLLSKEPQGRRRELLLSVIKRWMNQAEDVKKVLVPTGTSTTDDCVPKSPDKSNKPNKKKGNILTRTLTLHKHSDNTDTKGAIDSIADDAQDSKELQESDYEKHCGVM